VEIVDFVRDSRGGVTVVVGGHPQSYVDVADPGFLAFEYTQLLGLLVDTQPPGALAVTHVGGAGLTLARYVQHTRPGSPQIVLEPDEALTSLVRREVPLPRGHRIRVRPLDGRTGLVGLADGSADLVIVDAYAAGQVPADLTTREALVDAVRVLRPTGSLLLNLCDDRGLRYVARVLATLQSIPEVADLALLALHEVLKNRRFGNTVVVASRMPLDPADLGRRAGRLPAAAGIRHGSGLRRVVAGAKPLSDNDSQLSPPPPDSGGWRAT
jgi:spermidine synthase